MNIRVRMLCLIMLMSMTRLRHSLINRITRHVFLIMIRLRRIRRRLVIIRLIMLCLRMAFQLMAALAACISRQYSPHPLQLLSSTGCYLSVRCAGKQDWVLLVVVGPYTRMIWAEWCAKALGRIPFIASRSDARSTRCGRSWPAETLGVSRHHWLLIARQRKSLRVFILCSRCRECCSKFRLGHHVPGGWWCGQDLLHSGQ